MPYVNAAAAMGTERCWYDLRGRTQLAPTSARARLSRWFDTLVAAMSLQGRTGRVAYAHQPVLTASDRVIQRYPYLYLHAMGG